MAIEFQENIIKLYNIITQICTRDNITLLISVFGFALSIWNFSKEIWNNRSKLKLNCKSCNTGINNNETIIYFQLSIENCSRLPISISRMFFEYDNQSFEFRWIPETILTKTRKRNSTITDNQIYYSQQLPHTIDSLGVWGGFFCVHLHHHLAEGLFIKSVKHIRLHTNRGIKRLNVDITPKIINQPITYF